MKATNENRTCETRIDGHLSGRVSDLRILWERHQSGKSFDDDLGTLPDYGLCFDYVEPMTFSDQPEGYYRYQLSWGGPSGEFRFFVNPDLSCHRVEYWFMDWFDGAHRIVGGADRHLMMQLWDWLREHQR